MKLMPFIAQKNCAQLILSWHLLRCCVHCLLNMHYAMVRTEACLLEISPREIFKLSLGTPGRGPYSTPKKIKIRTSNTASVQCTVRSTGGRHFAKFLVMPISFTPCPLPHPALPKRHCHGNTGWEHLK